MIPAEIAKAAREFIRLAAIIHDDDRTGDFMPAAEAMAAACEPIVIVVAGVVVSGAAMRTVAVCAELDNEAVMRITLAAIDEQTGRP